MYEMGEQLERVILAGVQTYESDDTVQSLYELRELAETAGAVTVGTIMQSRETIHPATYLGKGKLEELKELSWVLCPEFFALLTGRYFAGERTVL